MRTAILFSLALAAFSTFAEKQPLERYQSIIDRQMFGPLPPGFDPDKLPSEVQRSSASEKELTKEQEQLRSAVHFSVINVTADGQTQVGFTDNSDPKAPKNYFLRVGETRDGWVVKEADAEKATMTIAKDEIEVSLSLGGNSANDTAATSRTGGAPALATASSVSSRRGAIGYLGGSGSLLARRRLRQQEEAARAAENEKAAAAAAEKEAERQAQAEQEKALREQERAEQRQQLLAIQEELKKVREAKAAAEAEKKEGASDAQNDAE